jgi:hypothetical protein
MSSGIGLGVCIAERVGRRLHIELMIARLAAAEPIFPKPSTNKH